MTAPWYHRIDGDRPLLWMVNGSRLFQIDRDFFDTLADDGHSGDVESAAAFDGETVLVSVPPALEPPSALSLNLAKACNLSCSYCYADEGRFGGSGGRMGRDVAAAAIDQLIARTTAPRVTIGFIGGEPFLNRDTMYFAVEHARRRAGERGIDVGFSVTTNGTLLNDDDISMLRRMPFAVTVSIDGGAPTHDALRPYVNGRGSHAQLVQTIKPLLSMPGRSNVSARATVTRRNLDVAGIVSSIGDLGFATVGISPLRTSAQSDLALHGSDWERLLEKMRTAATREWTRLEQGLPIRFSNFEQALRELHRGTCRALACGAGGNYVSVSAEGKYFTCHRTIDQPSFALGDTARGVAADRQAIYLAKNHVDSQQPCTNCWARYLCGGGCQAEIALLGRDGCDYIRGWLETCIGYYDRLLDLRPDYFDSPKESA